MRWAGVKRIRGAGRLLQKVATLDRCARRRWFNKLYLSRAGLRTIIVERSARDAEPARSFGVPTLKSMRTSHKKTSDIKPTAVADVLLRSAGLRRTPVRVGVLTLLSSDPHPLSAQQIIDKLPGYTDAVTVYRSLTTLTGKGLLHRVHGDDRVWRFAMAVGPDKPSHEHAHFVCDDCGTVECFNEVPVPPNMVKDLKLAKGYDVSYSEVLLHGTCPRCPKR